MFIILKSKGKKKKKDRKEEKERREGTHVTDHASLHLKRHSPFPSLSLSRRFSSNLSTALLRRGERDTKHIHRISMTQSHNLLTT